MQWFVSTYLNNAGKKYSVLDMGSYDVNGSYRNLFPESNFIYTGLDMAAGPNVDIVPRNVYKWNELSDNSFDVVISGQAFEHIEFFWWTLEEMARVLRPEGLMCVINPRGFNRHRYPVDCYRFDEDGMIALARYACLDILHVSTNLAPVAGGGIWYREDFGDSLLVAKKPLHWRGIMNKEVYTFAPANIDELRTGFVAAKAAAVAQPLPKPAPLASAAAKPNPFAAAARINTLAQRYEAENYLEIGVRRGDTFLAVNMPRKVAVDPAFAFDVKAHESPAVHFFSVTSDEFFAELAARPAEADPLTSAKPGEPLTFDIIYIDGLHTHEQSLRDFEQSLRFSHANTIWLLDDTVPCDPYSALPDQQKALALRRQAGLHGNAWHGDVFKTVFALHDRHPEFSYCTLMGGNPQTVVWRHAESHEPRTPVFASLEEIARLSYFDMLEHAALLMPVADPILPDILGMALEPQKYGEANTWGKLIYRKSVTTQEIQLKKGMDEYKAQLKIQKEAEELKAVTNEETVKLEMEADDLRKELDRYNVQLETQKKAADLKAAVTNEETVRLKKEAEELKKELDRYKAQLKIQKENAERVKSDFPNLPQKTIILFFASFIFLWLTFSRKQEFIYKLWLDPSDFFASPSHPVNKFFRKLLCIFGPPPLKTPFSLKKFLAKHPYLS